MLALVLPAGSATLIRRGAPVHLSLEAVVKRIPFDSPIHMDEQIYNSSVHVDGELGVAWTPYVFHEDEKLNHTGTSIFSMWKMKERGWLITGVADIAREVDEGACDAFGEAEMLERAQGKGEEREEGA